MAVAGAAFRFGKCCEPSRARSSINQKCVVSGEVYSELYFVREQLAASSCLERRLGDGLLSKGKEQSQSGPEKENAGRQRNVRCRFAPIITLRSPFSDNKSRKATISDGSDYLRSSQNQTTPGGRTNHSSNTHHAIATSSRYASCNSHDGGNPKSPR